MTNWNGFGQLNLAGVSAEEGRKTLQPGVYACRVKNAEIRDTKAGGGKYLYVELHDAKGAGQVTDRINIHNRNPEATEIGLRRLKALLIAAKHPNPDRPGDISSLNGLLVGVHVEQSEDWTDEKTGELKKGGGKPRERGAYFPADQVEGFDASAAPAAGNTGSLPFNDKIPFDRLRGLI